MARFPHLKANGNESRFPNIDNVEVFKYDNDFEYSRFDNVQMNVTLCKVPWDMGEAHIGNRTISGIGNVVYFDDAEARDAWFDAIPDDECFRFSTKYRQLHRDNQITVPVPFDVAARYNYIAVSYSPFAGEGDFVEYESDEGLRRWFWFVREVEFLAPNSTRLHLLNDAWQTFIYDMDIPYMFLERGHAPMAETTVDAYLDNPIGNCADLLADDFNVGGEPRVARSAHEKVFNTGNMYALVFTSASPRGAWGTKAAGTWQTPSTQGFAQGVPSYHVFAIPASSFGTFVSNMEAQVPQFAQTVEGICFVGADLITLGESFEFCSVACYEVAANYASATVQDISKADFGFDARYANIAKLYTYPYSYLVLTDADGNETEVRVEDTDGTVKLDYCLSLAFPYVNIAGNVSSVGATARRNVQFSNVTARNMPIAGNWYELANSWNVPVFAITQAASIVNDYSTHFDRAQQAYAADNSQANANAGADTQVANTALEIAANTAITARSNQSAQQDSTITQTYNTGMNAATAIIRDYTVKSEIVAANKQAAINAIGSVASGAVGALTSGNPAGAAAAAAGGVIGAATTIASNSVAVGLIETDASMVQAGNNANTTAANTSTDSRTTNQTDTHTDLTDYKNDLAEGTTANSAATTKANAARDRATVSSAISNSIAQAALSSPETFGRVDNAGSATTRPLALFANVVTQDDYSISRAGDEFLRYGYMYGKQYAFDGNWCKMPKFTYWKLSDFWVKGLQIPDMYVDKIRFFLYGGVTVWKDPADIGETSIYENI